MLLATTAFGAEGIVKFFNETRGMGYITPYQENADRIFYTEDIDADSRSVLVHGCKVHFEPSLESKRPTARPNLRYATEISVLECP